MYDKFVNNSNPLDALEQLSFDCFDSVTWLTGMKEDKDYQVQMWIDLNEN